MAHPPQSDVVELLGRIRHLLTDNGVTVLNAEFDREHDALVIEYTSSAGSTEEILADRLPWIAGMITGVLRDAGWPDYVDGVLGFACDLSDDLDSGDAEAIRWTIPSGLLAKFAEGDLEDAAMQKAILETAVRVEPDGTTRPLDVTIDILE